MAESGAGPLPPSALLRSLLVEAGLSAERSLSVSADPERPGGYVYLVPHLLWRETRTSVAEVCARASAEAEAAGLPLRFQATRPSEAPPADALAAEAWEATIWPDPPDAER